MLTVYVAYLLAAAALGAYDALRSCGMESGAPEPATVLAVVALWLGAGLAVAGCAAPFCKLLAVAARRSVAATRGIAVAAAPVCAAAASPAGAAAPPAPAGAACGMAQGPAAGELPGARSPALGFWPVGALLALGGFVATAPWCVGIVYHLLESVTVKDVGALLTGVGALAVLSVLAVAWCAIVAAAQMCAPARWTVPVRRLPARWTVPVWRLAVLCVALPVAGWSVAVYTTAGPHMGDAGAAPAVFALVFLGAALSVVWARVPRRVVAAAAIAASAAALGGIVWLAAWFPADGGIPTGETPPAERSLAGNGSPDEAANAGRAAVLGAEAGIALRPLPALALEIARAASDLDRDRHGTLFGGRDCDGLDPAVYPGAADLPANGLDEDCDGVDAVEPETALALGDPAPAPLALARKLNVVVIQLDAVRIDHAGFMGYHRDVTPNTDALAEVGVAFTNVVAQSPCTRKSVPSFMSGRYPQHMSWEEGPYFYPLTEDNVMLAEVLREEGYQTFGVVSPWVLERVIGLGQGFDRWVSSPRLSEVRRYMPYDAAATAARAIELIEHRDPTRPFFLFAYFEEPHDPYDPHAGPGLEFGDSDVDRYDSEIAFADRYAGFLIDYLNARALWDDTAVIILADHGVEFKEHGYEYHCRQLYAESLMVPLVLRSPGLAPARVETRVALLDLFPTVLDITGIAGHRKTLEGVSLLKPAEDRPIFAYNRTNGSTTDRIHSVMFGQRHYVVWPETGREELYDVASDRMESRNLATAMPGELAEARKLLARFLVDAQLK